MLRKIMLLVLLVFLVGCSLPAETSQTVSQTPCEELKENFDAKIDTISPVVCDEWREVTHNPILVGGKLIGIENRGFTDAYQRYEFALTFQGLEKQGKISIGTKTEKIPYEVGKFYKFDLANECLLIYSMASSGMFYDPNLNALERLEECE